MFADVAQKWRGKLIHSSAVKFINISIFPEAVPMLQFILLIHHLFIVFFGKNLFTSFAIRPFYCASGVDEMNQKKRMHVPPIQIELTGNKDSRDFKQLNVSMKYASASPSQELQKCAAANPHASSYRVSQQLKQQFHFQ